jgi:hypothetical protein
MKRGIYDVFALTLQPAFFAALDYQRVDRARYPEKIGRDCLDAFAGLPATRSASQRICTPRLRRGLKRAVVKRGRDVQSDAERTASREREVD